MNKEIKALKKERIDLYLVAVLDETRSQIQAKIKNNLILVNNNQVKPNFVLNIGDLITIKEAEKIDYLKVFEDSVWQSMLRSIGTSLSTILVLVAMMIFGTGIIQKFAFTVGIGVMTAFLSSIFIGAPMAYLMLGKKLKKLPHES